MQDAHDDLAGTKYVCCGLTCGAGRRLNTRFKFTLKGITRTVNPNYFFMTVGGEADFAARADLRHKPFNSRELNIFSVYGDRVNGAAGWASLPWCALPAELK